MVVLVGLKCDECGNYFETKAVNYRFSRKLGRTHFFCGYRCARPYSSKKQAETKLLRFKERFWSRVDKTPGLGPTGDCWEWTGGRTQQGYGKFSLKNHTIGAHRISYQLTNGPVPEELYVCHKCDNPPCIRPEHLFLGTPKDNTQDSVHKGRAAKNNLKKTKLKDFEARTIKYLLSTGRWNLREISQFYRVDSCTITHIKAGRTWKNILPLPADQYS